MIKLKVDNNAKSFYKGICAWAQSQIVYDLSAYDYFTAYLGVDISEQDTYFNTGLRFFIYTSDDGQNWVEKQNIPAMKILNYIY